MTERENPPTGGTSNPEHKHPAGGPSDADHQPKDDANTMEGRSDPATEADQRAKAKGEK
jgi:hypothetical protein